MSTATARSFNFRTEKRNFMFRLTQQSIFLWSLLMALSLSGGEAVSYYQSVYDSEYQKNKAIYDSFVSWGSSPDYYNFSSAFSATLSTYEGTKDAKYLERALVWGETMVSKATRIDYNGLRNWSGVYASPYAAVLIPYQLEDLASSMEMARLARIILINPTLASTYGARARVVYNFVRDNIVNKWLYARGGLAWFQYHVTRTDVALEDKTPMLIRILVDLKLTSAALGGADNVAYNYPNVLAGLAQGIKDHNGTEPRFESFGGGLIWDKGLGTEAPFTITDTAHGDRLIFAMTELYRAGIVFDKTYITGLANLLTKVIWNQSISSPAFSNFIDGSNSSFYKFGPWANGLVYSGWIMLAEFDSPMFTVMDATLKAILAGTSNPSLDYNNGIWGRIALAGHLAKIAAQSSGGSPPPITDPPPDSGTTSSFVTSKNLGTLRNNYSCWAGMKFTVGGSSLVVSSLGRVFASGNNQTHVVKLVKASTGADVINGSVSIYMGGGTPGEFKYVSLASPVTLLANTSYYLVSQENSGGDQWYNCDSTATSANVGSCDGFVYGDPDWYAYTAPGRLYGPVDFRFASSGQVDSPPPPDSDDPPPATETEASFVTGKVLGTLRNNYTCWPGMKFTVGPSPITVTSLGRVFASGNTDTHAVKLVRASDESDVVNGSVSISMTGGALGEFLYRSLANPVTLSANTSYYLVSQETEGGDQWYNCNGTVTTTSVGTCDGFVFADPGWNVYLYPGRVYVPVDFKYLK